MEKKIKKTNRSKKVHVELYDHVIETTFKLAAEQGWRSILLNEIAEAAGLTLSELLKLFPSKTAILNGFQQRTNAIVLASNALEGSSYRDRLFGVLMHRLDILQPYRNAIRVIAKDVAFDPLAVMIHGPQLLSSMASMLEAVGINSGGIDGAVRAKGLMLIYARTLRVWFNDNSPDLSETMAALDQDLARAERFAKILSLKKK